MRGCWTNWRIPCTTLYLAFALLDVVIDHYIFNLGMLGEDIETLVNKMALLAVFSVVLLPLRCVE